MFPFCSGSLELPSPYKQLGSDSRLATCGSHTQLLPLERNTPKSFFQRKPSRRLCLKRQRQKLLQLVQSLEALAGTGLNGSFSPRNPFFLPSVSVSAKDSFVGSSTRIPQLGQKKPKHTFPDLGGVTPLLAAPSQGSCGRALSTQLKPNREEPPVAMRYPTVAAA